MRDSDGTVVVKLAFLGAAQAYRGGSWNEAVALHTPHVLASRSMGRAWRIMRGTLSTAPQIARLDLRLAGYSWGAWTAVQLANRVLRHAGALDARLPDAATTISLGLLDPVGTLRRRAPLPRDERVRAWNVFQQNGCYRGCPGSSRWFAGRPVEGALLNVDVTEEGRGLPMQDGVPPDFAPDHIQMGYRSWGGYDVWMASVLEHGFAGPRERP